MTVARIELERRNLTAPLHPLSVLGHQQRALHVRTIDTKQLQCPGDRSQHSPVLNEFLIIPVAWISVGWMFLLLNLPILTGY